MKNILAIACATVALNGMALAQTAPALPGTPASGVEPQYLDPSIRAADDFYQHANSKWIATTVIPDDKPSWSPGYIMFEETLERQRTIIQEAASSATTRPAARPARSATCTRATWTRRASKR